MYKQRTINRYSIAFKQKVVSEIEGGKLSISEAQVLYDIAGGETIQNWIRRFGKSHLLNKVIRIEMKDEQSKIKELERQKRELESALAQAHLKIITLESTIKVLEEEAGVALKKNIAIVSSNTLSKMPDSNKGNTK